MVFGWNKPRKGMVTTVAAKTMKWFLWMTSPEQEHRQKVPQADEHQSTALPADVAQRTPTARTNVAYIVKHEREASSTIRWTTLVEFV